MLARLTVSVCMLTMVLVRAEAFAYEREQAEGSPDTYLFWEGRIISYVINQRGTTDLSLSHATDAVGRAFSSWASPSCTDVVFQFDGYDSAERTNLVLAEGEQPDHKNLIVWHEDRWPPEGVTDPGLDENIPAVTTLIYDAATGVISDADIDLNGYNFAWSATAGANLPLMDLESVIAHEAGHLLGLAHSKDREATMWATVAPGETKKRTLEKDDIAGVCFIYPAGDKTPSGPGQGTISSDAQGGCQIGSEGGRGMSGIAGLLILALVWIGNRKAGRREVFWGGSLPSRLSPTFPPSRLPVQPPRS